MSFIGWILAAVLGVIYLAAGGMKLSQPREKLLDNQNFGWANDFSAAQLKAIGAIEVLGGLGVILPWLLNIAPVLTPLAAVGLVLVQVGAMVVHVRRSERKPLPINAVLLLLALVVAVIRFGQL